MQSVIAERDVLALHVEPPKTRSRVHLWKHFLRRNNRATYRSKTPPSTAHAMDAIMHDVQTKTVTDTELNGKTSSLLHALHCEVRNIFYEHYFPPLPPSKAPLIRAHEYRPDDGLSFVDNKVCSETVGYLNLVSQAWSDCTWTVDLDHFFPPASSLSENDDAGAMYPDNVTADLTDADAAHVRTIEFSISAFVLPEVQGCRILSKAFVFQVHRLSTNRLIISSPLAEEYWHCAPDLELDSRIPKMLYRMHVALCLKQWYDKRRRGEGRRQAWTAAEIRGLLYLLQTTISELRDTEIKVTTWTGALEALEDCGVWNGRLPAGRKLRLHEIESYVLETASSEEGMLWVETWSGNV